MHSKRSVVKQGEIRAGAKRIKRAVIVSPTSFGSLGDQAMTDAAVGYLSNHVGYDVRIVPNEYVTRTKL